MRGVAGSACPGLSSEDPSQDCQDSVDWDTEQTAHSTGQGLVPTRTGILGTRHGVSSQAPVFKGTQPTKSFPSKAYGLANGQACGVSHMLRFAAVAV